MAPIAPGRLLRPGMRDARVAQLATRLVAGGYLDARPGAEGDRYDPALLDAVQRFQSRHGLQTDGLVGPATLHALNTSAAERLDQLRVNLERWRWLAGDIEAETLLVDIAGGLLSYYRDHQLLWQGRTVVGRPDRQTPQLKPLVSRLPLNPTWSVPPTILREDKLPEILRRLASRRTQNYPITRRLPIVMAYWTAQVAADGALILRNDFYARDAALLAALDQAGH
ncbi:peptidoglycan-binding protein [Pseudomonas sp. MBLB4123]|uniref:peptidoglycan-binding protein n=1 Tax=Pseudomonas sp. MBLB4123 TaxID=3451557 RepID=UPI003F75077E